MPKGFSFGVAPSMAAQAGFRLALTMGAVGLLGLMASGVVYALHTEESQAIRSRIDSKLDEARTGEKTARQLELVREEEARLTSQLRDLESSVTPSLYVPSLLRQVDQLARGMELDVVSIRHVLERTPSAPPEGASDEVKKSFRPLPYDMDHIDLEVRGKYWTLAKFVHRLTRFPKILAVETVSQQPATGESAAPGLLVARIRMTGFVFKDGRAEGASASSTATAGTASAPAGSGAAAGAMAPSIPVEN